MAFDRRTGSRGGREGRWSEVAPFVGMRFVASLPRRRPSVQLSEGVSASRQILGSVASEGDRNRRRSPSELGSVVSSGLRCVASPFDEEVAQKWAGAPPRGRSAMAHLPAADDGADRDVEAARPAGASRAGVRRVPLERRARGDLRGEAHGRGGPWSASCATNRSTESTSAHSKCSRSRASRSIRAL